MQYLDDLLVLAIFVGVMTVFFVVVRGALRKHGLWHGLFVLSLFLAPLAVIRILFTGLGVASGPNEPWVIPGVIAVAFAPILLWYLAKRSS